jgi:hypothetical protein
MTEDNDAELTIMQKFVITVREALSQDNSPQAQEIKKLGVEVEQIVSSKLKEGQSNTTPIGASAAVTRKTKALFNMFRTSTSYEPELMRGSVSVASRIVAGHKVQKTKDLFQMFDLNRRIEV